MPTVIPMMTGMLILGPLVALLVGSGDADDVGGWDVEVLVDETVRVGATIPDAYPETLGSNARDVESGTVSTMVTSPEGVGAFLRR